MANWDDIINNCLMMGRSRQLCYAANAERRGGRESEEEERRPGTRPLIGRGLGPYLQDSYIGKGSRRKISISIQQEGEVGHSQHPGHSCKFTICISPVDYLAVLQVDLGMLLPTSCFPLE